jgi:hypothetical protein
MLIKNLTFHLDDNGFWRSEDASDTQRANEVAARQAEKIAAIAGEGNFGKLMFSKKTGETCKSCRAAILAGQKICFLGWGKGASHVDCAAPEKGARKGVRERVEAATRSAEQMRAAAAEMERVKADAKRGAFEHAKAARAAKAEVDLAALEAQGLVLPVSVRVSPAGAVASPYDLEFVEAAKAAGARWDPAYRTWRFPTFADAKACALRHYGKTPAALDSEAAKAAEVRTAREAEKATAAAERAAQAESLDVARCQAGGTRTVEVRSWSSFKVGAAYEHKGRHYRIVDVRSRPMTESEQEWEEDAGQCGLEDVTILVLCL